MSRQLFSRFNTAGAVRQSVNSATKSEATNVNKKATLVCSNYDDPFVNYAYDAQWNIKLQRQVHNPVFECGYVE
jgi:hypothetical protein